MYMSTQWYNGTTKCVTFVLGNICINLNFLRLLARKQKMIKHFFSKVWVIQQAKIFKKSFTVGWDAP